MNTMRENNISMSKPDINEDDVNRRRFGPA